MNVKDYLRAEVEKANKSSRSHGAVGSSPIGFRYVLNNVPKHYSILDFGSGKDAMQSMALLDAGFMSVTAYEFGSNIRKWHDKHALSRQYDVVMANNVLNVQSSNDMLHRTLLQIYNSVKNGGIAVLNYPASPRYNKDVSTKDMRNKLESMFRSVEQVGSTSSAPLWKCTR